VIAGGQATCLSVDGYRFTLPPRLAVLVSQLSDQDGVALDSWPPGNPRPRGYSWARAWPARP